MILSAAEVTGAGVQSWLREAVPTWSVCGLFSELDKFCEAVRLRRPTVAVLVEDDTAASPMKRLRETCSDVRALCLARTLDPAHEAHLLAAGAAGALPITVGREELVAAVRRLCEGKTLASVEAMSLLTARLVGPDPRLTDRQIEILQLLADGETTLDIAKQLFVEPSTVKTHVFRLCRRLGFDGRDDLEKAAPVLLGYAESPVHC